MTQPKWRYSMKHTGSSFSPSVTAGTDRITEAIVSPDRIVVDWVETDGKQARFEIHRRHGIQFSGTFGYKSLDQGKLAPFRKVEFDVFQDPVGEVLLLGKWWNERDGGGEDWLIRLTPKLTKS